MDLFKKAYEYTDAEEVIKMGLYPYFRMNETAVDTTTIMNGRKTVMIGSNNYLGLTSHPYVKEAAIKAVEKYGTGCTGSRFLNGTIDLHVELEARLAKFMKKEDCLVFTTGFTTNQGIISTLVGKHDVVICDRTNHASILDGCRLAYGKLIKFRHNDMEDLEEHLINLKDKDVGKLIVVDGVFSMEGDLADLKHIVPLAKKYGCRLMVDEAHSLGVLGKHGRGTCEELGVLDDVDLIMGTFSKSFASLGGFVAGEAKIISYLKHNSRAFIFQAAPPPSAVATVLACLDILEKEPERLTRLRDNVSYMLKAIRAMGFRTWNTESAIIPIIIGDDLKTFQFSKMLEEEGVYVNPVVSPAVPKGMASVRTSYTATHKREELDFALEKLKKVGLALDIIGARATDAPVEIKSVSFASKEKTDQAEFLNVPGTIYGQDKNWVPQMVVEVESIFDKTENLFFQHGDAQAFLAFRGDRIVGRIIAGIDHRTNQFHKEKAGFFGFFEVEKDYGAAAKLFDTAREWLEDRNVKVMRGPMTFSPWEGMGCLIEGFDLSPAILMPYNPDYYQGYMEQYGFKKAEDFYAYWIDVQVPYSERLAKVAAHTCKKEGITIRHMHTHHFRKDLQNIMNIFNDSQNQAVGFTSLNENDLQYLSDKFKPLIEPELINFVEVEGKPVAFSIVIPDYNEVFKHFEGRIKITDMLKYFWYSRKIKNLRFALLGVRKAYQRRGLETLLYVESFKSAKELGYTGGELSWIPENNKQVNKAILSNGGKLIKTYRLYEIKL
jgi:8-amino-7-oxononanoate synthase